MFLKCRIQTNFKEYENDARMLPSTYCNIHSIFINSYFANDSLYKYLISLIKSSVSYKFYPFQIELGATLSKESLTSKRIDLSNVVILWSISKLNLPNVKWFSVYHGNWITYFEIWSALNELCRLTEQRSIFNFQ